jgi:hypothetical protein
MDERGERIARNEVAYRDVNEAIETGRTRAGRQSGAFVCECGQLGCNQLVELTLEDYEAVRAHPRRFFMLEGHDIPDVEDVIEHHDGWIVAEKHPAQATIAEENDPRSG